MAERPGVLRVNDRVVFSGTAHTVVAISGATIRLLSAAGATTVVALPFLLSAADFELVGAAPAPRVDPHGMLDALPAQALQAARDWERHLIEVETGLTPEAQDAEDAVPRPEYDPGGESAGRPGGGEGRGVDRSRDQDELAHGPANAPPLSRAGIVERNVTSRYARNGSMTQDARPVESTWQLPSR